MAENFLMLMSKACRIKQKRLETVKVLQLKYLVMNTSAMYLFYLFLIHLRSCDNSVFALSIWCMECRLMWKKVI